MQTENTTNGSQRQQRPQLTPKTKGLLVALPFAAECIRRGGIVSEPLGDDARYDLVVDNGHRLFRVQVKTASKVKGSHHRYSFSGRRRNMVYGERAYRVTPYSASDVDCIVTHVEDHWFIYLEPHTFNNNVWINAAKPNDARDNWKALGLQEADVDVADEFV
jgi:PD-(D/E)XK endonuclease